MQYPPEYCPPGFVDREKQSGKLIPGDWRAQATELSSYSQACSFQAFPFFLVGK